MFLMRRVRVLGVGPDDKPHDASTVLPLGGGGREEQENGIFQEDRRLVGAGGDDEQENGISQEDRRLVGADGGRRTGERDFSGGQHTVTVLRHVHSYFV